MVLMAKNNDNNNNTTNVYKNSDSIIVTDFKTFSFFLRIA